MSQFFLKLYPMNLNPNSQIPMSNETPNPNVKNNSYDLMERTAKFGEDIIEFVNTLPRNETNRPLISQTVRSGTSIGANYMEADGAISKKDFENKSAFVEKKLKKLCTGSEWLPKSIPIKKASVKNYTKKLKNLSGFFHL